MARLITPLRLAAVVLATVAMAMAATPPAGACNCFDEPPLQTAVSESDYTVRGLVTKAIYIGDPFRSGPRQSEWSVRVLRSYKNCVPRYIRVTSGNSPEECGQPLEVGTTYLFVFKSSLAGKFHVTSCGISPRWANVSPAD
eukprot:contig_39323_g9123